MRHFQLLDTVTVDDSTGIIQLAGPDEHQSHIAMRQEGEYLTLSASYGPIEIALRLRHESLTWTLSHLQSVEGLQTSRQVGTGQAYLAVGLKPDKGLVLRPTIVGDASGHISFNLEVSPEACAALYKWLSIDPDASG